MHTLVKNALGELKAQLRKAEEEVAVLTAAVDTLTKLNGTGGSGPQMVRTTGRKPFVHWTQRASNRQLARWRRNISKGHLRRKGMPTTPDAA